MVPRFLQKKLMSTALAFVLDYGVDDFMKSWADTMEQFLLHIRALKADRKPPLWREATDYGIVEELTDWAYFRVGSGIVPLGAFGLVTGSKQVLSLEGGGISVHEAKASAKRSMLWTIYALSLGHEKQFPTRADWAAENPSPGIKMKCNLDQTEAMAKEEASV